MNLTKGLAIDAADDVPHQCSLFSDLPFDHQRHVHVVKDYDLFAVFQAGVYGFVLIYGASQAERQVSDERESFTRARFVLGAELPVIVTSTSRSP